MFSTFKHPLWGSHQGAFHEFSPCLAALSAAIAKDSYQRQQNYRNTLESLGFESIQMFVDNLQILLARKEVALSPHDHRTIYALAFRGTDALADVISDFDFRLQSFPISEGAAGMDFLVHNGMYVLEQHLESQAGLISFGQSENTETLLEVLEQEEKRNRALFYLCGHSLGGGIAVLFALRLIEHYGFAPEQIVIYTFGAPPVASKHLAQRYTGINLRHRGKALTGSRTMYLHRMANIDDPVSGVELQENEQTHLPRAVIPSLPYATVGLHHIGTELRFCPRLIPEFAKAFQEQMGRVYSNQKVLDVHCMAGYALGLELTLSAMHKGFKSSK
ncbi:MAG: lipase family protein [Deltaproteobacteria bacterium]